MPKLLKTVTGEYLEDISGSIKYPKLINAEFGLEDYFKIYNLTGFLQNFTKINEVEYYTTPEFFGLVVNRDKVFINIEVNM